MTPTTDGPRASVAPATVRGMGRLAAVLTACVAVAAAAAPIAGQQGSDADTASSQAASRADTASVADSLPAYRREVFDYPDEGRRNPFQPVEAGVQEGPQFQNLRLSGVIYAPSVGSVAVLVDERTGERYRVRSGQRIGDARVLEIRRSAVRFAVSSVGQTRRETLQVKKQEKESQG